MDMQPILPVTVPVKKIKGAARQRYGDGDGVVRCKQILTFAFTSAFQKHVKFLSTSRKRKPEVRTLPLVIDTILENAKGNVTRERSFKRKEKQMVMNV